MKIKTIQTLLFLLISTCYYSCTDVIDVDVPTGAPRLVVEASIEWEKGSDGKEQTINLSMLTPYFEWNEENTVVGAVITVTNIETGDIFPFVDQNNGKYTTNTFIPVINNRYELTIIYSGKTYKAEETLMGVANLETVNQTTERGNSSDDIEVNLYFQDPGNIDNYYYFKFHRVGDLLPTIGPMSDEFTDGNLMDVSFEKSDDEDTDEKEELKPGEIVHYEMHGISERYYNYMQILVNQLGSDGGLFGGVPVELKGNCINVNDTKDFTLGYFRLTESVKGSYTIE